MQRCGTTRGGGGGGGDWSRFYFCTVGLFSSLSLQPRVANDAPMSGVRRFPPKLSNTSQYLLAYVQHKYIFKNYKLPLLT